MENTREKVKELLGKYLCSFINDTAFTEGIVNKIERGIFDHSKDEREYKELFRKCYANIKSNPNAEYVRSSLLDGTIDPYKLATTSHQELNPQRTLEEKMKEAREAKAASFYKNFEKKDSMFSCGRCKSKKVEHTQLQTRSGDESMTVFCFCTKCGKRWKFS